MRSIYRCHHFYNKNKIFYISVVIFETVTLASGLRFFSQYFVVIEIRLVWIEGRGGGGCVGGGGGGGEEGIFQNYNRI